MDSAPDLKDIKAKVGERFSSWFIPGLSDFVRVPNLSPMFDPEYFTNGRLEEAIECIDKYAKMLEIEGLKREIVKIADDKPPLVLYIIEGEGKNTMLYAHLDK